MTAAIKPDCAGRILWSVRPACGEPGCKDPQCVCSLCGGPIGTRDDNPRWETHSEDCDGCQVCDDQVPVMLFRGEGRSMQRAQFHNQCFAEVVEFRK